MWPVSLTLILLLPVPGGGAQSRPGSASPPSNTACPWITTGSAAGVLGGDVDLTTTVPNAEQGTCRFVRQGQPEHSLEISVGDLDVPACSAESPKIEAIANEAARCGVSAARGEMAEMVSGRVRNLHFAVILRGRKRIMKSSGEREDALQLIAEEVAGNLF